MRKANIELCFKVIDLETTKYKVFKKEGKQNLANHALHARGGMVRMLAALLGQPVEKLAEIRKLVEENEGQNE